MTIELALLMLFEGNLYDDKGYVSAEGYKALETLEGVTLTRNIDAMEDDAKQASIPYSYQMPKDYIKNKLDYSNPTVESDKELYEKIETYKNSYRIMSDAFENEVRKNKRPHGEWIIDGHHYKCSRCGKTLAIMFSETDDGDLIGCPFCLADMRGGAE